MTLQGGKKKVVTVGNYRFTGRLLGKGNFARVEEAVHTILSIKVAIKIMDVNQIKEDYVIRNLCREAKIMSKLNHPCIAALYQTMQRSDNVYYLVTELVSGGDLCSFVKGQRNGRVEERPTRIYARQFASALSHMHGLGVVHRDLKMENVMLNSIQTQIKIVDFGLSNVWAPDNPLRTHCGSPEYAAPELFVTGKTYGAEVDLWSLGIILYGMVLGQLPFVSSRHEHVTSQERRKKLVAQINKGLSAPHRRALACFSPEFRHVMNRLLVADSSKRISVRELVVHPWITEKGRRFVRSNPIRQLDAHWQAKIIAEISTLLQVDPNSVMACIEQEPLGKVGGMFNVLVHKHQISLLNGDGISRQLPSVTLMEAAAAKSFLKEGTQVKVSTARTNQPRKPSTATTPIRRSDFCTPRPVLMNNNSKSKIQHNMLYFSPDKNVMAKSSKKENVAKARPNSVQNTNYKNYQALDYRLIKSPTLRRKAYSAAISPKTNRSASPREAVNTISNSPPTFERLPSPKESIPIEPPTSPKPPPNSQQCLRDRPSTQRPPTRRPSLQGASHERPPADRLPKEEPRKVKVPERRSAEKKAANEAVGSAFQGKQSGHAAKRDLQSRIRTAAPEKSRTKTDPVTKRPFTVGVARPSKPSSGSPATLSYSSPRAMENNVTQMNVKNKEANDLLKHWEKSPLAYGDTAVRSATPVQKQSRKPIIYDPIARSIADYVVNNVPEKMHNFSWYKK